jgi:2-hydroxy-6-oxonona-2,4-dienedioate hydrolase
MSYVWPNLASRAFRVGFVNAGGLRTRLLEAGDSTAREAVIFVHGTGGHLEAFTRNYHAHAEQFRTLGLDMVGHGFSDKPDHDYEIRHYVRHLLDFCDVMGIEKAHLHGESLGGWIVAQFAIDHPDRTASLTLNTAGGLNTDPKVMQRVYEVTMKAVAEASSETVRARLEWLMHDPKQVTADLIETRLQIYSQPNFARTMQHILCLQHMDIRMRNVLTEESLGRIGAPTLVIWTDHDPTAPVATGERFVRSIPKAEKLVVMDGCAHWPQWEAADKFNQLHLAFLNRHRVPQSLFGSKA